MTELQQIRRGLVREASEIVTLDRTAPHIGSGSLSVYATPAMVVFLERTCATMVGELLPEGQTTVGIEVKIRHLAPTPMGCKVSIRAEVVDVAKGVISFRAQIWDETEEIGTAMHKRMIIDEDRFLKRVTAKA